MIKHKYFNQQDPLKLCSPPDENEVQETPCRVSEAELLLSKMSHYCTLYRNGRGQQVQCPQWGGAASDKLSGRRVMIGDGDGIQHGRILPTYSGWLTWDDYSCGHWHCAPARYEHYE